MGPGTIALVPGLSCTQAPLVYLWEPGTGVPGLDPQTRQEGRLSLECGWNWVWFLLSAESTKGLEERRPSDVTLYGEGLPVRHYECIRLAQGKLGIQYPLQKGMPRKGSSPLDILLAWRTPGFYAP